MKLSLKELIKQLQEEENPNLPHQDTNVVEITRTFRGLRIVTEEGQRLDELLGK